MRWLHWGREGKRNGGEGGREGGRVKGLIMDAGMDGREVEDEGGKRPGRRLAC
jgi:hypothetical protein